jgi:hypothetical protein
LGFDSATNKPTFLNPGIPGMDDPVPNELGAQMAGICGNYQASYTIVYKGISSISTNLSLYNANLKILSNVHNTLKSLSTQYCYDTLTTSKQEICNSLSTGVAFFNSTLTSPTTVSIGIDLNNAYTQLANIQNYEMGKAYSGFGCETPSVK